MPVGTQYSPVEVATILNAEQNKHGDTSIPKLIRATYIVLRESGGKADAFRPASQNPNGGDDRGWWQWNSKAWPNISDAVAYDPAQATAKAYEVSKGFTDFGPWKSNSDPGWGVGPQATQHQATAMGNALAAVTLLSGKSSSDVNREYTTFWNIPVNSGVDVVLDTLEDAAGDILDSVTPDWVNGLGRLLANLLDPKWWARIGIGALGIAAVIIALVLYFGNDIKESVSPL